MTKEMTFNYKKSIILSLVAGIFAMTLLFLFSFNTLKQSRQKEQLDVTKSYVSFQESVNQLINSNILLLNGYSAHINSGNIMSEEETLSYLQSLTKPYEIYIRNVGIIKDTTILYNYPKAENAAAIGIDLAKVEGQREVVLRTKSLLTPIFQGPVTLVQGGEGFIIRVPLIDEKGAYWGQVSVVLKADVIIETIEAFALDSDLRVGIRNNTPGAEWIVGDESILHNQPLQYVMNSKLINWELYVMPIDDWTNRTSTKVLVLIAGIVVFLLISIVTYIAIRTNYRIKHNSYHDKLTGLYNRYLFEEYQFLVISSAQRNGDMFGLILIDLNNFKAINDTYGHKVGDSVLVETSRLLLKESRSNEAVFRLGGDEFLIVVPKLIHTDELLVVKNRIETAFINDFRIEGYDVDMMPSIGIATYPKDGDEFDQILHKADTNMYEEKNISKLTQDKK